MVGVRPSLRGTSPAFWFLKIVVALIAQLLDLLFKFLDLFSPVWICWCHLDVVCLSLLCVAFIFQNWCIRWCIWLLKQLLSLCLLLALLFFGSNFSCCRPTLGVCCWFDLCFNQLNFSPSFAEGFVCETPGSSAESSLYLTGCNLLLIDAFLLWFLSTDLLLLMMMSFISSKEKPFSFSYHLYIYNQAQ